MTVRYKLLRQIHSHFVAFTKALNIYILTLRLIYATADEADAYMFYRCFFVFCFFSVRHKNTRQPFSGMAERIFMKLLPNDSGENGVCIAVPKWGLGARLNFLGLKTTHCALSGDAWRMTQKNYFMLVCWLLHCAATAVELQMHEGVNAFNLVLNLIPLDSINLTLTRTTGY